MTKFHVKNVRIKRKYAVYQRDALGRSEASVVATAKALDRFETYTGGKDFGAFHFEQARGFKRHLAGQTAQRSGKPLSVATQYSTLMDLKRFFRWLAGQPGYRSKLTAQDADYFSPPEREARIAKGRFTRPSPTLDQVRHVLRLMPTGTTIEKRNRALVAFIALTGARDAAVVSFKLKHLDLAGRRLFQDARDVKTKFSKTFMTTFFPVGDEVEQIVVDWVNHLRTVELWGNDDPLFPSTRMEVGAEGGFQAAGLARKPWSNATAVRTIFKDAFQAAGLNYFPPHSFRHMLVLLAERICKTPQEMKAWSQNLGHEHMLTTLLNYGTLPDHHQAEIIGGMVGR